MECFVYFYFIFSILKDDCIKFWRKYQLREEKIVQIATGFHHSVMLTDKNQIYCNGLNNHGQCGMSNLSKDDHIVKLIIN